MLGRDHRRARFGVLHSLAAFSHLSRVPIGRAWTASRTSIIAKTRDGARIYFTEPCSG
jgi:hypothetical protein